MTSSGTSSTSRHFDFVVVGAGVVGASIAQSLSRRGAKVLVIDRAGGIGGGCSYANAAILAPHHVSPLATPTLLREAPLQMVRRPPAVSVRPARGLAPWLLQLVASAEPIRSRSAAARLRELATASTSLHCRLGDEGLNPTLRKTGAVDVHLRPAKSKAHGRLDENELRALEPALAAGLTGTHDSEEWTVESQSFVRAMLNDATAHGAEVRFESAVNRMQLDNGRTAVLTTTRGNIQAEHVVLAAGLGARDLAAESGINLPLRGGRGYVLDLTRDSRSPSMPVRIKEHRVVVTPLRDRIRICGSIEFGKEGRPANLSRLHGLRRVAEEVLPSLRGQDVLDQWAGDRPCLPDGLPAIGRSEAVPNLSIATGHGMWGMILAPITAKLLTEDLLDGRRDDVLAWLSPDRFGTL